MRKTIWVAFAVSLLVSVVAALLTGNVREPGAASDSLPPEATAAEGARADSRQQPHLLGTSPGPAGSSDRPDTAALVERVDRVEAQLADLARQVARTARPEDKVDLSTLSGDELRSRASSMLAFRNYVGALGAYQALLAREPEPDAEEKSKILSSIAQIRRATGDLKEADKLYQQVEALHGEGSAGAMTAHYQRAWIRLGQKDIEGARDFMRDVASAPNTPVFWRLYSRANAADFSIRMGDTTYVREDLEEFLTELENDDSDTVGRVRGYVKKLLQGLDD